MKEPAPRRIVSLVPSLTESLFVLGLGERVVGVTDYCVHPAEALRSVTRIGGTKDADVDRIASLAPDLVIANREENTLRVVQRLEAKGLRVWVTYPRTVRAGAELLAELAQLGASEALRREVVDPTLRAVESAEAAAPARRTRVFCPIWRDPWMSVGADTYIHDMLSLCGGENVFAQRGDRRYPRISLDDVEAAAPEVMLLPDEPYAFAESDRLELARLSTPAGASGRIHLIDGTWVSWYGPRIASALRELGRLVAGS